MHWLGDFVFVESGLGVRVKFDLVNTVYLTVTAEHMAATRGLCGIYNNNADGERSTVQTHLQSKKAFLSFYISKSFFLDVTLFAMCAFRLYPSHAVALHY